MAVPLARVDQDAAHGHKSLCRQGGWVRPSYIEEITLAQTLHSKDRVHIPRVGEVLPKATPCGMSDEGRIDIKLADATLLETLPRIGPTYAQRIVAYREMNGPFETIEKNQDVQGSGPATLEKIRAQITFREHP